MILTCLIIRAILIEEQKRKKIIDQIEKLMRLDHGHQMLDDLNKNKSWIFCDR